MYGDVYHYGYFTHCVKKIGNYLNTIMIAYVIYYWLFMISKYNTYIR